MLKKSLPTGNEKDFYMTDDGSVGRREAPGVRRSLRLWRHGEAYGRVDPDELSQLAEPPEHSQVALKDVLGEWAVDANGDERLKIRVHPHMHRWALYEREYNPLLGQNLWRCFYIFQTDPVKGYLPPDLDGDLYKAHLRGTVGDYVEPTREHFEMIEKCNIKKYGYETVNEYVGERERLADAAIDAKDDERIAAFLDEHWALARDEANQNAGSGQYMNSAHCMNWRYKCAASRWKRVQKNGYSIVEKKSREEYELELVAELERFKAAWGEAVGLKRAYVPTEDEWTAILEKAGVQADSRVLEATKTVLEKRRYLRTVLSNKLNLDITEEFINRAPSEDERTERLTALKAIQERRKMVEGNGGT